MSSFLLFLLIHMHCIGSGQSFTDVKFFMYEICSFNGTPTYNQATNEVTCECQYGFTTDDKVGTIKDEKVKCSYKQKKRMICMFLSLLCPFGIAFFYLEFYFVFALLLILFLFGCCSSIVIEIRAEKQNQTSTKKNVVENSSKVPAILSKVFTGYRYVWLLYWVIEFSLMSAGVFKDGNGFEVFNDLGFIRDYIKKKTIVKAL